MPSSNDDYSKKKRITSSINNERNRIKRKRSNLSLTSIPSTILVKNEQDDNIMMSSSNMNNNNTTNLYQQTTYPTLPPCSNVFYHRSYDRTSSLRTRSVSSSVIPPSATSSVHCNIKNPMSVQPTTINSKQIPFPLYLYDKNNNHHYRVNINEPIHNRITNSNSINNPLNVSNEILKFNYLSNSSPSSNRTTIQSYNDNMRKSLSIDQTLKYFHHDKQVNILLFFIHK